jgi:hypothetical protein
VTGCSGALVRTLIVKRGDDLALGPRAAGDGGNGNLASGYVVGCRRRYGAVLVPDVDGMHAQELGKGGGPVHVAVAHQDELRVDSLRKGHAHRVAEFMAESVSRTRKSKPRGRPPTGAESIHLRLVPDQLAALDQWISRQTDMPSRPEAIRRLIVYGLTTTAKRSSKYAVKGARGDASQSRSLIMSTGTDISALYHEFTDALTEILAENAVGPARRGRLARARAAVKKHPE